MDAKEYKKIFDLPTKVLREKYHKQLQRVFDGHQDFIECVLNKIRPNYPDLIIESEPRYRIQNLSSWQDYRETLIPRMKFELKPTVSLRYSNSNAEIGRAHV